MKKVFSFFSVSEFLTYATVALLPRLDSSVDDSKYFVKYQILSGLRCLSCSEFASRLFDLVDNKTFSFHISLYVISRADGRFISGKRRRFVVKRLSANYYSVYERL